MVGYPLSDEKRIQLAIQETGLIWTRDSLANVEMNLDVAREVQQVIYKKNLQIELLFELAEACAMNGLNRGPGWTPAQHARTVIGQLDRNLLAMIEQKERMMKVLEEVAAAMPREPKCNHEWSSDGERCLKCGDKDWMT